MATNISANMLLPIPQVGVEAGPQYATDVNNSLTIIDQHDHSAGHGVQITPDGLNINSDLSFGSNNLTQARSLRLTPQSAALSNPADIGCLYEVSSDLYYNDASGNQIRITQNGAVAGTPGSISNLVSPASAAYSAGSQTFVWQSAANTPANMDAGSYIFRNITSGSQGVTVSPPASLASSYAITLPALPASTLPLSISSSGAMSAAQITLPQLLQSIQDALNPPGVIAAYGGTAAPSGWLLCDGSAVSRSTYSALFTAIGTANGAGDGSTTFNLPDGRGEFLRGVDGTRNLDPDRSTRTAAASGGNTGNNVGSIQTDQFKSHSHPQGNESTFTGAASHSAFDLSSPINTRTSATGAFGGNETRPVNMYVNFIIKT